jgi:uncharacterized membrane protein
MPAPPQAPQPPSSPGGPPKGRKEPSPLAFVGAGFEFAAVIAMLGLGGWWLDGKWGTKPWLLIAGVAVGLFGGIYKFWRTGRQFFD